MRAHAEGELELLGDHVLPAVGYRQCVLSFQESMTWRYRARRSAAFTLANANASDPQKFRIA